MFARKTLCSLAVVLAGLSAAAHPGDAPPGTTVAPTPPPSLGIPFDKYALANGLDGLPSVRVGMNTGPAVERNGDFFGSTVNLAARLGQAARGGEVLLTKGYGLADLETGRAITAETIFETGSVAKQFTATAVVLLALEGKLNLDERVEVLSGLKEGERVALDPALAMRRLAFAGTAEATHE